MYKVFVSTGYDHDSFYCEREGQAHLLFNMAVDSKMFSYVELCKVEEECFGMREWSTEDEW